MSHDRQRRKPNKWLTLAVVIGVIAVLIGRGLYEQRDVSAAVADVRQIEMGRTLYATHCTACHGDQGEGRDEAPSLNSARGLWEADGNTFIIAVASAESHTTLPPLSNDEDESLLPYIKTFWATGNSSP